MRNITVKIGSSVLLTQRNKLDEFRIAHVADQILLLLREDIRVVLVVSGAVACGANIIRLATSDTKLKKAAAGVGQIYLISAFQHIFSSKGLQIGQILLTRNDLDSGTRQKQLCDLLEYYLERGVVPIINENDVLELNSFGGNDFLAAHITKYLNINRLVILSTMAGSTYGVGGGRAKTEAISMLKEDGIAANVVDGKTKNILLETLL